MKTIDLIVGARPNFMKIASLYEATQSQTSFKKEYKFRLIHTGQHYDDAMSDTFFSDLNIPIPDINFGVGSGSHAEQTSKIMIAYENLLEESKSDLCIVVGDVNSTLACSIVAKKKNIPIAHIEAGLRSNDWTMPEEINRVVTDSITDYFFTTSVNASNNLIKNGIREDSIFFVCNTMIDSLMNNIESIQKPELFDELLLEPKKYFLLTLHRPANVDQKENLVKLLESICQHCQDYPVIFPIHPRTKNSLDGLEIKFQNLKLIPSQSYLEFMFLLSNCFAILTDSGGITEESTILGVPCLTIRDNTERPETIEIGTNVLIGTNPEKFEDHFSKLFHNQWKKGSIPEKWDGKAGLRIIKKIENKILR